jgi:alkaline phosphatase
MKRMTWLLVPIVLTCSASTDRGRPAAPALEPKKIILIVGDGMGPTHVTVARIIAGEASSFERFPVSGFMSTYSANSLVTDSAASATAFATGVKTNNGAVGVDAAGKPVESVLERAEQRGMATGVVTTTNFFDATPAAFAAHNASRREGADIVRQMLGAGMELIFGGGAEYFGKDGVPPLESVASSAGYTLLRTRAEVEGATGSRLFAVFPTEAQELDSSVAPLPVLASKAISIVSQDPDGFFLLIEHEGVDGASHANMTDGVLASLRSLDEVVVSALDFAAADGNTLVIVLGDHETGGLAIASGTSAESMTLRWTTQGHTGTALPIFAYGPGATEFTGLLDNTDVAKKIFAILGGR